MKTKHDISDKEAELLRYIIDCKELGYTPTINEMINDLGIARSKGTIAYYLQELERFGYISKQDRLARRIRVIRRA